jgi:hypothetical protein
LTFAQISLGLLSGISEIEPFFVMNISLFDTLGMIFPIFTIFFLYLNSRSSQGHSWYLFFYILGGILLITFSIAILGIFVIQPEEENPALPDANATSPAPITMEESIEPIPAPPPPINLNPTDPSSFLQFLTEIRGLIFVIVLLLPLLILIAIQRLSRQKEEKEEESVDTDEIPFVNKEQHHRMKTILECYNQASIHLEEHGADTSTCFTPTEFSSDVVKKELTPPPLIDDLTDVFEEAKFSNHDISTQKVDLAKSFSSKIIFSSDSSSKTGIDTEREEIE